MDALILVGGLGTRLRGVVDDVPKPMAPVAGEPFLVHVLRHLGEQGVTRVIMLTGHLGDQVERFFGSSYEQIDVDYSHETEPLGTGGAVRLALARGPSAPFLLLNGDTFVPLETARLAGLLLDHDQGGLAMTVAGVDDVARFGAVVTEGDRAVAISEKGGTGPGLINAGAYLLGTDVVEALARREAGDRFSFETDVLEPWLKTRGALWWRSAGPFLDIGVPEDYRRAAEVVGAGGRVDP